MLSGPMVLILGKVGESVMIFQVSVYMSTFSFFGGRATVLNQNLPAPKQ